MDLRPAGGHPRDRPLTALRAGGAVLLFASAPLVRQLHVGNLREIATDMGWAVMPPWVTE